jgi:hypothetical protein
MKLPGPLFEHGILERRFARFGKENRPHQRASDARQKSEHAREIPARDFGGRCTMLRIALICVCALSALYLIGRYSIPAGLSETGPEAALSLNASYPGAVVGLAQQAISDEANRRAAQKDTPASAAEPADLDALKKSLRAAILKDPLNASAFQLLAQIAQLEGNAKSARQMMTTAARLSIEDATANAFMLQQSLLANNVGEALRYADILMRGKTSLVGPVAQLVARMTEVPGAKQELVRRLGAAPPWRAQVLGAFASSGLTNPQAPLGVLLALKDTPNPPREKELVGYINYLLQNKLYAFAYSSWLQFLPRDRFGQVAYLFNGSFEQQMSGVPFDWMIGSGSEVIAGVYARPDNGDKRALFISFGQMRGVFPTIRQMTVLRPGAYRFTGNINGEMLARRGLQWRVTCVEGGLAGESQMLLGRFPKWASFQFDIVIPEDKCAAQYVELGHMARSPSEQLATGSVWFDDLAIVRRASVSKATP